MFSDWELKEGWATVAFLMLIYLCVAMSVQSARWTNGLSILQAVILVAGLFGILTAKSRVPAGMAHFLSLVAAVTWGGFLTSRVVGDNIGLPMQEAVAEFERQLTEWIGVLFGGGTVAGNYVFLFLLALGLWVMAYVGAWAIFRWQQVWWTVILCGAVLLFNINAAPSNLTGYMIAYAMIALLLVVRTNLAFYQEEWHTSNVGYSSELVYGFLRAGLVMTIVTILLAWAAPQALASRPVQEAWDKVSEPWRRLQDQSSRIFQDLNYRSQPAFVAFSRETKFGGAVELTDTPVMDIEAAEGRYWRVIAFHDYMGDGWRNTDVDTILIDENEQKLAFHDFDLRTEVTHTITLRQRLGPTGVIPAAAQPVQSDLPLRAVVTILLPEEDPDESSDALPNPPTPGDPSIVHSRKQLQAGESYQVVSSLTKADATSLRQAGTDYPDWVAPRYLQLPDSLPERVRLLAEQVTVGRENPYDQVMAIERYLRDIPYNEKIEGPEPEQDGVDYFLFESREGYCDYYASAMVVMLRTLGIPARYVQGYAQPQRVDGIYHILARDGHAWPEVFFPGYGWVEFEPTAGEPVLVRPRGEPGRPQAGLIEGRDQPLMDDDFERAADDRFDLEGLGPVPVPTPEPFWQRLGRGGGLLLALVAFVLVATALLMVRRQRRIEGLSVAERVYEDLVNWVRRLLRISPLAHQTPNEYAMAVVDIMPQGRAPVVQIADLYVRERFGGKDVPGEEAETAWSEVRPALWRSWVHRQGERLRNSRFNLFPRPPIQPDWQQMDTLSED